MINIGRGGVISRPSRAFAKPVALFWSGCYCNLHIWSFSDCRFIKWAIRLLPFLGVYLSDHIWLCGWGDLVWGSLWTLGQSWSGNACSILLNPETQGNILFAHLTVWSRQQPRFVDLLFRDGDILSLDNFFCSLSPVSLPFISCKHDSVMKGLWISCSLGVHDTY